ncbi:MAG: hypothetical protein PVJ21_06125 [Anaerolineales bacterium]|jgi:hypothetical protein
MPTRLLIPAMLVTLLLYACGTAQPRPPEQVSPSTSAPEQDVVEPTPEPTQETVPTPVQTRSSSDATSPPTCLGDEVSSIGQAIADEYESVSYDQVMTWFCNGAEFEDILVALETESQTGTPTEEMLQMLADDFTWDEIWLMIGLTEGDQ